MDEKLVEKYMQNLGISREDALALIAEDDEVDKMSMKELDSDLTEEQKKASKQARTTPKKATVYTFSQRERKENPVKSNIISEIADFLAKNSENSVEMVNITNKERQIAFKIGENDYELTLVQKRKPKTT